MASETDVMQLQQAKDNTGQRPANMDGGSRSPTVVHRRKLERVARWPLQHSIDGFSEARYEVVAMHEYRVAGGAFGRVRQWANRWPGGAAGLLLARIWRPLD